MYGDCCFVFKASFHTYDQSSHNEIRIYTNVATPSNSQQSHLTDSNFIGGTLSIIRMYLFVISDIKYPNSVICSSGHHVFALSIYAYTLYRALMSEHLH